MDVKQIKRGSIILCELKGAEGTSVQASTRPCIVVSNQKNNTFSTTLNVVPLSSKNKKCLPSHVDITSGVVKKSTALVEQIVTISKTEIIKVFGSVDDATLKKLNAAIAVQLAI